MTPCHSRKPGNRRPARPSRPALVSLTARRDLTAADVRFLSVYSYLIVYRPETKPLQIVAILHAHSMALLPLIQHLLPVYDDESVHFALPDKPGRIGGFSERCRSAQDTLVVVRDFRDGVLLEHSKLTSELRFNPRARVPFIPNFGLDLVRLEKSQCLSQTSRGTAMCWTNLPGDYHGRKDAGLRHRKLRPLRTSVTP